MKTCKLCTAKYGFSPARDKDRIFKTDEELFNHMEEWHGQIVVREGETEEEARERCAKKGIVEDMDKCQCRDCMERRGEIDYPASASPIYAPERR